MKAMLRAAFLLASVSHAEAGEAPSADLSVLVTAPHVAVAGTEMAFSVRVFNRGPSGATNVLLYLGTPQGFVPTWDNVGCLGVAICKLDNLNVGWIDLEFHGCLARSVEGAQTFSVFVRADTLDPSLANNGGSSAAEIANPAFADGFDCSVAALISH